MMVIGFGLGHLTIDDLLTCSAIAHVTVLGGPAGAENLIRPDDGLPGR
jgi:hypothetical protein